MSPYSSYVTWGFTAGVFTPPSGEQDQLGDCTNFAMGKHVCEDGWIYGIRYVQVRKLLTLQVIL